MCELSFHHCPTCGEEYRCNQQNSECPVMNHYDGPCQKCDFWSEESRKDSEREDRDKWERERWISEHGYDYEN